MNVDLDPQLARIPPLHSLALRCQLLSQSATDAHRQLPDYRRITAGIIAKPAKTRVLITHHKLFRSRQHSASFAIPLGLSYSHSASTILRPEFVPALGGSQFAPLLRLGFRVQLFSRCVFVV